MWEKSFGFVVLDLSGVWVLGRDVKLGRLGLSWRWDPVGIVWNLTLQMFSLGPGFRAQDMPPNPPLILGHVRLTQAWLMRVLCRTSVEYFQVPNRTAPSNSSVHI